MSGEGICWRMKIGDMHRQSRVVSNFQGNLFFQWRIGSWMNFWIQDHIVIIKEYYFGKMEFVPDFRFLVVECHGGYGWWEASEMRLNWG